MRQTSQVTNEVAATLAARHYLGPAGARARLVYTDAHGLIVFSGPASRRLPTDWLELSRWCIAENGVGSKQWAACVAWLRERTAATTVVSYSDPSVGHLGALYRASGWIWAPTWHVLSPPPTGNGTRGGKRQAPKHRWVYLLAPDPRRESILALKKCARRMLPFSYREPRWKRGTPQVAAETQRWKQWREVA